MELRRGTWRAGGVLALAAGAFVPAASGEPSGPSAKARECFQTATAHRRSDPLRAALHFQCACDAGLAVGCFETAHRYRSGEGVARNDEKAREVWQVACRAAELGDCADGDVPETLEELAAVLRTACNGASAYACVNLGYLLEKGLGAPPEPERARFYYALLEPRPEDPRVAQAREDAIARGRAQALARAKARAEARARRPEETSTGDPEVEAAKRAAARSSEASGYEEWRRGLRLFDAESEACVPVAFRGAYYVRVRSDGSIGSVLVRPKGDVATCIERAMSRVQVAPPPGGRDAWVTYGFHVNRGTGHR